MFFMTNTTTVPPGVIRPRTPRPLTGAEKAKLRKDAGGHATAAQLAKLATPKPKRRREAEPKRRDSNGWSA